MAISLQVNGQPASATAFANKVIQYYDEGTNTTEYSCTVGATAESSVTINSPSEDAHVVGGYIQAELKISGATLVNVGLKVVGTNMGTKYIGFDTFGLIDPENTGSTIMQPNVTLSYVEHRRAFNVPIGFFNGDESYTATLLVTDPNIGGTTYVRNVTIGLVFNENLLQTP